MKKRVLDVGQCGPDHASICAFLGSHFDCEIVQTHGPTDTMVELKGSNFDLVLINRKLDQDYTDGVEIIHQMKADPATADVPVMLVTNYEEHQDTAQTAGALRGFGKLEYDKPETLDKVRQILG